MQANTRFLRIAQKSLVVCLCGDLTGYTLSVQRCRIGGLQPAYTVAYKLNLLLRTSHTLYKNAIHP